MRRLVLPLLAALGLAAAACGSSADGSDGSLQIDPVNGCVSGGNCKRDSGAGDTDAGTEPTEDPTSDPTPAPSTPTPDPTRPPENTCQTATDMGAMNGEHITEGDPSTPKTITGTCDEWVKIRVNETSKWLEALGVDAKLTSPATQKFDLYAYIDTATDDLSCVTPYKSSATTLGQIDEVSFSWGDSVLSDDSRTVTLEVKSKDGKCPAGATWSLAVDNYADPYVDPSYGE